MAVNVNEVGRDSWERRKVASSLFRSAIVVGLAVAVAGLAVHPLWLGLAYLVSLAIGLDCGKRSKTGQRTRVVRLLAWLLGRGDLRPGIAVALAMGGVAIVAGMMIGHSEGCVEALRQVSSPGSTSGDVVAALKDKIREAEGLVDLARILNGFAGTLAALFAGATDGMWIGRVSARRNIAPWKLMSDWRSWRTWDDERSGRRREYWVGQSDGFE